MPQIFWPFHMQITLTSSAHGFSFPLQVAQSTWNNFFSFVGKIKTYNPCIWSKFFNKQNKVYHLKHIPMHCNLETQTGLRLLLYFPLRLDLFPIRIYSNFRKESYHLYNKSTILFIAAVLMQLCSHYCSQKYFFGP